jgi:hypothetical protein
MGSLIDKDSAGIGQRSIVEVVTVFTHKVVSVFRDPLV